VAATTVVTPAMGAVKRFHFKFVGRGYGHGIGMSQYGAEGAALAGMTAEQIIAMYFPGTQLQQLPTTTVRVLLGSSMSNVQVTATGPWNMVNASGVAKRLAAGTFTVTASTARIDVRNAGGSIVARSAGTGDFVPVGATLMGFGSKTYRGSLRIGAAASRLTTVNVVDLEDYLPGVVPLEMPASWHPEALRAQVIAARSYAMATKRSGDFDMYADERSQMYGGVGAEDPRTTTAVRTSSGLVATYDGRIATTFFSSTSGGLTESVQYAWGGSPVPYLVTVNDNEYDKISPRHIWRGADRKVFSDIEVARALGLPRRVIAMRVIERSPARRALTVRVVMPGRRVAYFTGATFRWKFGLPSTWFYQYRQRLVR
jgi:stage II sporulation protein D